MTVYGLRISDWSSDVCSSDLPEHGLLARQNRTPDEARLDQAVRSALLGRQLSPADDGIGRYHGKRRPALRCGVLSRGRSRRDWQSVVWGPRMSVLVDVGACGRLSKKN